MSDSSSETSCVQLARHVCSVCRTHERLAKIRVCFAGDLGGEPLVESRCGVEGSRNGTQHGVMTTCRSERQRPSRRMMNPDAIIGQVSLAALAQFMRLPPRARADHDMAAGSSGPSAMRLYWS